MNNILNEPPSDAFEDYFFDYLSKYNTFGANEIKEAIIYAHDKCGGEYGDEASIGYGIMLCNGNKKIRKENTLYIWKE